MTMTMTRRLMLGVLPALGFAGQALAQTGTRVAAPKEDEASSLLDAWGDGCGQPTAKVMLNGVGPFRFMVDTGSATTVIAERHLTTLGASRLGDVTVIGTGRAAGMPRVRIGALQTGAVTRLALDIAVLPDAEVGGGDGILGADVFAGRQMVFDRRRNVVRIEPMRRKGRPTAEGNLRMRNGLLVSI